MISFSSQNNKIMKQFYCSYVRDEASRSGKWRNLPEVKQLVSPKAGSEAHIWLDFKAGVLSSLILLPNYWTSEPAGNFQWLDFNPFILYWRDNQREYFGNRCPPWPVFSGFLLNSIDMLLVYLAFPPCILNHLVVSNLNVHCLLLGTLFQIVSISDFSDLISILKHSLMKDRL